MPSLQSKILTLDTRQLLFNVAVALDPNLPVPDLSDRDVVPEDHFRTVRRVLNHLLGDDIRFSTDGLAQPNADQERKLSLLYQSDKARQLCADTLHVPEADVSTWLMQQFFARIAWLNESVVVTDTARAQLENYLYVTLPFWGGRVVLGQDEFSELGELLVPVPDDLRLWMVQFRRGARLVPIAQWVAMSPAETLYNGLAAWHAVVHTDSGQDAISLFCESFSRLIPTTQYRDRDLLNWLNLSLEKTDFWSSFTSSLTGALGDERLLDNLQVDLATPTSLATRLDYLRKLASYVVDPDNEQWLASAIAEARRAPGMRALSLAIRLSFEHSGLAFESAILLASLILFSDLESSLQLNEALPGSQLLNATVPRLDAWSPLRNANQLFARMGIEVLCRSDGADRVLRLSARETWHALIHTSWFESTFSPMLDRMDWYTSRADEGASPRITQALAGRAIIDYFLGAPEADGESLETSLRSEWVLDYSHRQLSERVKMLIRYRQPDATTSTVDLLHYLVLREAMPELLVEGVPDHLQYGRSLQSVAFIHGVALIEAMTPGLSVTTPYDELIKVSADLSQSQDPEVHRLWATALTVPALRYATAHGVVRWSGTNDVLHASPTQISEALSHVQAQQEQHAQELNSLLSIKPPDRRQLAQQLLQKAGVDRGLWDQAVKITHWPVLQDHGFTIAFSYSVDHLTAVGQPEATVLELVMMGEAYIPGTPTIPEAYASAFDTFRKALVSAQTEVIKRLLNEMQPESRDMLFNATCEISRVRFGTEEGTQGLFLRCQRGDHRNDFKGHSVSEFFFELIPASGVARETSQRFTYAVDGVTWSHPISIPEAFHLRDAHQRRIEEARTTPLLPMDSDAYLTGTVSRVITAIHTPAQGTLVPSSELVYLPAADEQASVAALAAAAASHLLASFMEKSKTEHQHETNWERIWTREREYADAIARFIVPFYSCIKDLESGDHSAGVIVGCVIDIAFALVPLGQFAGSTARIVLRAGEMSVWSVTRLTGKAVGRLIVGLAEQSGAVLVRDVFKVGIKLGRLSLSTLLEAVPSLKAIFASRAVMESTFSLDKGMYRILDTPQHPWQPRRVASDSRAVVDGRSSMAVRDVGTAQQPDFRLLDPEADRVFGKRLTPLSSAQSPEFSVLSAADSIGPDRYPPVLPITSVEDGFHEARIDRRCSVSTIQRAEGEYDILIDGHAYHLDADAPNAALRKRPVARLSSTTETLRETENLCRVRRDLISVPCATGVKLTTPAPEPVQPGSTSPKRTGKHPSHAMDAREFTLDRQSLVTDGGAQDLDVFVNEGKYCKWSEPVEAQASTSSQASVATGRAVVPLSERERALLSLPETPAYLPELQGTLADDHLLGLPENFGLEDSMSIYQHVPVVELGAVASGVQDTRTLRGIRMEIAGQDWIFVEADTGVFYKARTPSAVGDLNLRFSRVEDADEINTFVRLSEQYRVFRERPDAVIDQENIARLLFDLVDESERASWHVSWSRQIKTYDNYASWCQASQQRNELLRIASDVLSGEAIQKRFVDLARASIPDFRKIAERTLPEQQHIVDILNRLMPVQGSKAKWEMLSVQSVVTPKAARNILDQVKGANLSFVQVYTESGERMVYYALSGGLKAKALKLQVDLAESAERVIDGVVFRDARARMAGRLPDPGFTSLPVVRDADRLVVREFGRQVDSERLIATVLKEDLASTRLTHIKVFTVMDTCRSCGGFVLPRLKLDFPDAQFSVTYLKDYGRS
ncbi:deaminase domain-containing protein [Pseudomonas alliivorans]|nr:deaminase domain-containing protein [Pseudomonas alliivorans]